MKTCGFCDLTAPTGRPTPPPTMGTSAGGDQQCTDRMDCQPFVRAGYCASETWGKYMSEQCAMSCGACEAQISPTKKPTTQTGKSCKDKHTGCRNWKNAGYCSGGTHGNWMASNCPLSCGACEAARESSNEAASGNSIEVMQNCENAPMACITGTRCQKFKDEMVCRVKAKRGEVLKLKKGEPCEKNMQCKTGYAVVHPHRQRLPSTTLTCPRGICTLLPPLSFTIASAYCLRPLCHVYGGVAVNSDI